MLVCETSHAKGHPGGSNTWLDGHPWAQVFGMAKSPQILSSKRDLAHGLTPKRHSPDSQCYA